MTTRPSRRLPGLVTLTTDFGTSDGYAGAMKGVILRIDPSLRVVDITHEIPPQDLFAARAALDAACPYFPRGTVHVAVVDPGVGSARRPIAVEANGHLYVGPDNGIFTSILVGRGHVRVVDLTRTDHRLPRVSRSFHGRDIFAPVAAHLALGMSLGSLGAAVEDPILLSVPFSSVRPGRGADGEVVHVDSFGNLITNLTEADVSTAAGTDVTVRTGRRVIRGLSDCYAAVRLGAVLAVIGSDGHLEVSVNQGRADQVLGLGRGARIRVLPSHPGRKPSGGKK